VPKASATILEDEGFRVKYRGVVSVKGKGEMETYFVIGKKIERSKSFGKSQYAQNNSLAAVLSAMVQVRKKHALGSSLSVPSSRPRVTPGLSSLSFNFRKPRSPHRLHRMLSEVSTSARGKKHRFEERRMTETGSGSHSFPDMSLREAANKKEKDDTVIVC
jgi:adenylate cyclase 8